MNHKADAEVHYLRHDTPVLEFERDLAEALGNQGIERLALYIRRKDRQAVFDELERLFDSYWSRVITARLDQELAKAKQEAEA